MEDSDKIAKLAPFGNKVNKNRAYVKDADLQILMPQNANEAKQLDGKYTFKDMLGRLYTDVNALQHDSDAQIQRLVAGETEDIHAVTKSIDEAETSFELMMKVHQKLIEAYEKIQNI